MVAYCNATSSARLAALYPASGGTYLYGRKRLGDFWGYLAGWAFVVGKTASCAAMALTVGSYAWPSHAHPVAVAAVVALTAVNYAGVQKSAWLTRIIVALVLAVLAAVVVAVFASGTAHADRLGVHDCQPSRQGQHRDAFRRPQGHLHTTRELQGDGHLHIPRQRHRV